MSLTWKDGLATLLVATSIMIATAALRGYDWLLLGSWRSATALMLVLGIATCALTSTDAARASNPWTLTASIIGGIGVVIALLAIILNSKELFITFVGINVLLWIIATLHHVTMTPAGG